MTWAEICIHTTKEAEEAVSNILYDNGANGLVVEDPLDLVKKRKSAFGEIYELDKSKYPDKGIYIKVYFPKSPYLEEKIQQIKNSIIRLEAFGINIGKTYINITNVEEKDWETAWQKYYKPVSITDTITIVPSWEDYESSSSDEKLVYLDPGMAFGTGTHPTTKLSVLALEKYIRKDDDVIDVGCGSGILSIISCLLGAKKVLALDFDEVAVKSAQQNRDLNRLNDKKIIVRQNDLLKGYKVEVDLIVSNILAEIILNLIDDAWDNLKKDGLFITSGIIDRKKEEVSNALINKGFQIIESFQMENWICIVAKK